MARTIARPRFVTCLFAALRAPPGRGERGLLGQARWAAAPANQGSRERSPAHKSRREVSLRRVQRAVRIEVNPLEVGPLAVQQHGGVQGKGRDLVCNFRAGRFNKLAALLEI